MAICKECKKKFHSCTACGFTHDWERNYCSHGCYMASPEYKKIVETCKELYESLNDKQRELLADIISDEDWIYQYELMYVE